MEKMIANSHGKLSSSYEFNKDKGETKKSSKPSKASTKEIIATSIKEPIWISRKPRVEERKGSSLRDKGRNQPMLKDLQENKYPFSDLNLLGMLEDLLEKGMIEFLTPKKPQEVGRAANRKYCHYHQV